jgi:hypothetical protein
VSRLVVYAGELIASLGVATPVVVEQVSTLCASWAAKISRWLKDLIASIRNLMRESGRLGELIEALKKKLGIGSHEGGPEGPKKIPPKATKYDGMSTEDLIGNRGANIGRDGSGPKVREVESVEELEDYFKALTRDGYTDITPPGFPGQIVKLPDGTVVNWRTHSRTTGSVPTVDVNPGPLRFKVHVNPNGW